MKKLINDHRIKVTKMLIRKAFLSLLEKKPIQSISVKELCEEAGLNRGTFYSHYSDIYKLKEDIEEDMLQGFCQALEPLEEMDEAQRTPVRITTEVFRCLKENSDLCTVTLGPYGDKAFALKLLQIGREICVESYSRYFQNTTPRQIEYFYAFASSGCIGILQKWLADGMTAAPEEVAEMAECMMTSGMGFLCGRKPEWPVGRI